MNRSQHSGLHPDAELLSAFAEQALAATEREQVLGHLATCSRCRQIVAFSADAAAAEAALAAPAPRAAMPNTRWWDAWRVGWIPASALAMALLLLIVSYSNLAPWRSAPTNQVARNTASDEHPSALPAPPPTTAHNANPAPERPVTARPPRSEARRTAEPMPAEKSFPVALEPTASFGDEPAVKPASALGKAAQWSVSSASPAVAAQPAEAQLQAESANATWTTQAQQTATVETLDATRQSTEESNSRQSRKQAFAKAMHREDSPASAGGFHSAAAPLAADPAPQRLLLPEGAPPVSMARVRGLVLALDPAGSLFMSGDAGQHWESVPQQWTGRAVVVRTPHAATAPAFELVNDSGHTWASADGKAWSAK